MPPRWWEILLRRPAVATALVFIAGTLCHALLPHTPWVWIIATALAAGVGFLLFRRDCASSAALCAAIFCAGVAGGQICAFRFPADDIGRYAGDHPRLARLELEIDEPPRVLTGAFNDGRRALPPRQVTRAKVVRVLTNDGWVNASGRTLVQIDPPNPELRLGQRVRALGMLQRPSPAMNPGQFDWTDCAVADGANIVRTAFWSRARRVYRTALTGSF